MFNKMRFTIAIPVRNGSEYLADCIRSALSQTRPADEVLVLDDNSQDNSAAIAQSSEWGGRVKYCFNAQPTGFADAWNRAAAKAAGDYVSILHQDDFLDLNYLLAVEDGLNRFPKVRHLYAACRYVDGNGQVLQFWRPPEQPGYDPVLMSGRDYAHRYLHGVWQNRHFHRCPGVTTSRALLLEKCAYRKEAGHIADDDFFYRVGAFTDVVGISKPMASYREHATSTTSGVKILGLVLARDYLFQITHKEERAKIMELKDELLFEELAARKLNEALCYILRSHFSEWRKVLDLENELNTVVSDATRKYLPVWTRPMWIAVRKGHIRLASLYILAISLSSGLRRRLQLFLTPKAVTRIIT